MSDQYFVVTSTEDGTTVNRPLSNSELLERITPNEHGETYYGKNLQFLSKIPESYKGFWRNTHPDSILIIKGEVVVPRARTVAVKLEID